MDSYAEKYPKHKMGNLLKRIFTYYPAEEHLPVIIAWRCTVNATDQSSDQGLEWWVHWVCFWYGRFDSGNEEDLCTAKEDNKSEMMPLP